MDRIRAACQGGWCGTAQWHQPPVHGVGATTGERLLRLRRWCGRATIARQFGVSEHALL